VPIPIILAVILGFGLIGVAGAAIWNLGKLLLGKKVTRKSLLRDMAVGGVGAVVLALSFTGIGALISDGVGTLALSGYLAGAGAASGAASETTADLIDGKKPGTDVAVAAGEGAFVMGALPAAAAATPSLDLGGAYVLPAMMTLPHAVTATAPAVDQTTAVAVSKTKGLVAALEGH